MMATRETIVRTLGLPACATLEYYWDDMHFVAGETIPHRFFEDDDALQEALVRLGNRTGLIRKTGKGWRIDKKVYEAIHALTPETEKELYRAELIRQTIAGAMEKYGLVSMASLYDVFRKMNMPEDAWKTAYGDLFEPAYYEVLDEETDTCYVSHPALENPGDMLAAQTESGVFAVSADPLQLRLSAGWLPEDEENYFDALEWLSKQGVTPEDAAVLLQNAIYALQGSGDSVNMIVEIEEALGIEAMPDDAVKIFEDMADSVPRWAFNGISMHELQLMQQPDFGQESPF